LKLGELIPQVFYDAIARLTPGLVIIFSTGIIWFDETASLRQGLLSQLKETPFYTGVEFIIAAYVTAFFVEGVRKATKGLRAKVASILRRKSVEDLMNAQWSKAWNQFSAVFDTHTESKPNRPSVAIAIDAIRLAKPDVGSRIVKLRAEVSMCKTLVVGWTCLLIVFIVQIVAGLLLKQIPQRTSFEDITIIVILALAIKFVGSRHRAIGNRHLRALYNHWLLLINPGTELKSKDYQSS
jgi:hypothetical protein